MYVITYKGKPATIAKLAMIDNHTSFNAYSFNAYRGTELICSTTKKEAIEVYLYNFGFTWRERLKGVECQKAQVVK